MTQQELADKTGVTRQTIAAIEGSKYSPTLELAFNIAHVFKVPLDEPVILNVLLPKVQQRLKRRLLEAEKRVYS